MRHTPLLIVGVALALAAHTATAQRTVRRADLDSSGRLRILISTGRVIRPSKDSGQVAFEQITVSADRRMVGWVALHRNCCTSYPIPLELVLLRADGGRTVIGNGMPIWQWAFVDDGRSVVIRQAPVHGAAPTSYERRDIRTGRLMAAATVDSISPSTALPAWARGATPRRASSTRRSNER